MVALLGFERFVAVLFPLKVKLIVTKKNVMVAISLIYTSMKSSFKPVLSCFAAILSYNLGWSVASDYLNTAKGNCVLNRGRPDANKTLMFTLSAIGISIHIVIRYKIL